ncbi:MAG TPA: YceI family protein [Alloacidobacterium sp.]|nr:YceI family protein [Alloacidobacterium sp.]
MNLRFRQYGFLLFALLLGLVPVAEAQSPATKVTVHLDTEKTEIHWTLHTTLHTVQGSFRLKGGIMTFDPKSGAAQGEFLVDVGSGESGDETRDEKMQSEVLESRKYPEAFFHPVKVSGVLKPGGTANLTVEGTLNLHGADHPLTLQTTVQMNGSDAVATTHFIIPYAAWGMKDESRLLLRVDKEVSVDVVAQGTVDGILQNK